MVKVYRGVHWGRHKENGVWIRRKPYHPNLRYRVQVGRSDTLLFAEVGYLQVRLMKPGRA